jgi:hypothetical protein
VNFKSQDALTLIADYISLKNKVSTDTTRNRHTARQTFSIANSYLLKPLMRTSATPAAIHVLGNKCATGIMSGESRHIWSLNFYLP